MNTHTVSLVIGALVLGVFGGYFFANIHRDRASGVEENLQHENDADRVPEGMHRMPDGTLMHNDVSMEGNPHTAHMMVRSEKEFIEGMIPHHQEAVDTAREVLARGGSMPEMITLAEGIIDAQEQEISDMRAWYEAWYGEVYTDTGTYVPMMRELEGLSGALLDVAFLEDMIVHHEGAIMMAESVRPYITKEEIAILVDTIVLTQTDEIAIMWQMLEYLSQGMPEVR